MELTALEKSIKKVNRLIKKHERQIEGSNNWIETRNAITKALARIEVLKKSNS